MPSADAGPFVFVADIDAPELDAGDARHLVRVLRLRPGAGVILADGAGRRRSGRLVDPDGHVEPVGDIEAEPRPQPELTVAFAVTKGSRPELAVQKLTEVGVDCIVPFHGERSVARWDADRADRHVTRLRRIAREAAMQCRRAWLPEICGVVTFEEAAARPGAALADPAGAPLGPADSTVLVGPEGGWSDTERAAGLPLVALGPHVLRAETAALVAGALMAAHRAGLVGPPS